MKFLVATHNPGKFAEIMEVLKDLEKEGHLFVSLREIGIHEDCEETGSTYEENALLKARFYSHLSGLPTIADDSGIQVDALEGELGVKTRRWGAGAKANDEEWMDYFMRRMEKETNRDARFLCAAAFAFGKEEHCVLAETQGQIMLRLEASISPGIPLSAVFKPKGFNEVYSALSVDEKNRISHRGKAFKALKEYLHYV
ncbi:non-canonical purine NTP pyrophosphatase [Candidatus Peregrinibacteria bacterium]|nr:MAG: non-canonical purine NTP pyrophosphatase [Candidatus Peregrinibacteria bacterium]